MSAVNLAQATPSDFLYHLTVAKSLANHGDLAYLGPPL